jgi:hypothetical protein
MQLLLVQLNPPSSLSNFLLFYLAFNSITHKKRVLEITSFRLKIFNSICPLSLQIELVFNLLFVIINCNEIPISQPNPTLKFHSLFHSIAYFFFSLYFHSKICCPELELLFSREINLGKSTEPNPRLCSTLFSIPWFISSGSPRPDQYSPRPLSSDAQSS